jgi:hypothetical protein
MAPNNPPYKKPTIKKPSQLPQTQAGPSSRPEEETFNTKGPKSRTDHSYINMAGGSNPKFRKPTFSNGQTTGSNPTRSTNTAGPSSIGHKDSRSSSNHPAHHSRASPSPPLLHAAQPSGSYQRSFDVLQTPSAMTAPVRRPENGDQSLLSSPLSSVGTST